MYVQTGTDDSDLCQLFAETARQVRHERDAHQMRYAIANMTKCIEKNTLAVAHALQAPGLSGPENALNHINGNRVCGHCELDYKPFDTEKSDLAQQFVTTLLRDDVKLVVFDMDYTIVTKHSGGCLHGSASYEAYLSSPAENFVELIRYLYLHPLIDLQVAIATYSDFAYYFFNDTQYQRPESTDGKTQWAPSDNPVEGQFTGEFSVDDELEASITERTDAELPVEREIEEPKYYHNMLGGAHLVKRFLIRTFLSAFVDDTARDVMTADETKMATYLEQIIIVARNPAIRASSDTSNHNYNASGKTFHLKRIVEIHLQRNGIFTGRLLRTKREVEEAVYNFLWYHTILFDDSGSNVDVANGLISVKRCNGMPASPRRFCRAFLAKKNVGFVWNSYAPRWLYPLCTADDFEDLYFPLTVLWSLLLPRAV